MQRPTDSSPPTLAALAAGFGWEPAEPAAALGPAAGVAEHGLAAELADAHGLHALLDPDLHTETLAVPAALAERLSLCRVRGEGGGWALEVVAHDGRPLDLLGPEGSFLVHPDDAATALLRPPAGTAVLVGSGTLGLGVLHGADGSLALQPLVAVAAPVAGAAAAALLDDALRWRQSDAPLQDDPSPLARAVPADLAAARALLRAEIDRLDADLEALAQALVAEDDAVSDGIGALRGRFGALAARRMSAEALRGALSGRQDVAALDRRLRPLDQRGALLRTALGAPVGDGRLQTEALLAPYAWWADSAWCDDEDDAGPA